MLGYLFPYTLAHWFGRSLALDYRRIQAKVQFVWEYVIHLFMNYCAPKTNASTPNWGPRQPLGARTVQKTVMAVIMPGHYRN